MTGSGFSVEPKLIRSGIDGKSTGGRMLSGIDAWRGSSLVPGMVSPPSCHDSVVTSSVRTSSATPGLRSSRFSSSGFSMSAFFRSDASAVVSPPLSSLTSMVVSSESVVGSIRSPLRSTVPSFSSMGASPMRGARSARLARIGEMSPLSVMDDLASSSLFSSATNTMPHGPAQLSGLLRVRSKVSTRGVTHSQVSVEPPRSFSPLPCVSSRLSPVRVFK